MPVPRPPPSGSLVCSGHTVGLAPLHISKLNLTHQPWPCHASSDGGSVHLLIQQQMLGPSPARAPQPAGPSLSPQLDFEYTAYALMNMESEHRLRQGKVRNRRKKRGETSGYRLLEAMKGNQSAASLLYDEENEGTGGATDPLREGEQSLDSGTAKHLAAHAAESTYLGELHPPFEPRPCSFQDGARNPAAQPPSTLMGRPKQQHHHQHQQQQQRQPEPQLPQTPSPVPQHPRQQWEQQQAAPPTPLRPMLPSNGACAGPTAPQCTSPPPWVPASASSPPPAPISRSPQRRPPVAQSKGRDVAQPQQQQQQQQPQASDTPHIILPPPPLQQQQQLPPEGMLQVPGGLGAAPQEPRSDAFSLEARVHCARAGRCLGLFGSSLTVRPRLRGVLLQLHPPEVAGPRFQELQAVLGVRYQVVLRVVSDCPQLLLLPEGSAAARAARVGAFLGHTSPQDTSALLRATPELLTCPSPLEDSMCALARVLVPPLELPELAGLLTAHPGLLAHRRGAGVGGANAAAVVRVLTEHMRLTRVEAVRGIVAAAPTLLLRSPGAVRGCCTVLEKTFELGPEALASTVSASPSLLLRSPAELELACARVTRLLSRSTHWHAGLRALRTKPAALAHTLSFDSSRFDRLQYLTSTLRDGSIKWHAALTMPEADWLDMYSGYKGWWAKRAR